MRVGLKLAALSLAVIGGLALARPALADEDHNAMPEKLKAAGFFSELDPALKKAQAENKVVLVYLTPSWFT